MVDLKKAMTQLAEISYKAGSATNESECAEYKELADKIANEILDGEPLVVSKESPQAVDSILKDRRKQYGPIKKNLASMRAIIRASCTQEEIADLTDEVLVIAMIAGKLGRRKGTPRKKDTELDVIGYMKLLMDVTDYDD